MRFYKSIICLLMLLPVYVGAVSSRQTKSPDLPDAADPVAGSINLDEVVVTARVKPVFLRGDTIVINPAAFRLRDGTYLEELVSRVPGLTYDKTTGQIAYYGESLNGVLVNGKKFFGPDTDIAMENMPVELLDEVKIYKRSPDERTPSAMASESSVYVIDLGTKGNLEAMTTANAEAGAGNKDKKYLSGTASRHRAGGDRIVLRGNTGNRHLETRYPDARKDNLSLSFGKNVKSFDIDGKVEYGNDIAGNAQTSFAENYLPSGNNYAYSVSDNVTRRRSLSMAMGANGMIGKRGLLDISASLRGSKYRGSSMSRSSLFSHDPGLSPADPFGGKADAEIPREWRINDDISTSDNRNTARNYNLSASYRYIIPKTGGLTVALRASADGDRYTGHNNTLSEITYYRLTDSSGADSLLSRRRYEYLPRRNRRAQAGIGLSRSFGRHFSASLSYAWVDWRQTDRRDVYGFPAGNDTKEYVDSLGNHTNSVTRAHEFTLRLGYNLKEFNLNCEFAVEPRRQTLDRKSGKICGDTVRRSTGLTPTLQMRWQVRNFNIDFSYKGNTTEPDLSQLMMMTDNSNPLYITHGNPGLKTAYRQDAELRVSHYGTNLHGTIGFSNSYNTIAQARTYNPAMGGYEIYPVNVNGQWELKGQLNKFQSFGESFMCMGSVFGSRSQYVGLQNRSQEPGMARSVTHTDRCQTDVRMYYRPGSWDIGCGLRWDYMRSVNRLNKAADYTRDYEVNLSGRVDLPHDLFADTNLRCLFRNGSYVVRDDSQDIRWNMSAGWRFMKRKMTLTVEWFDILNKSRNITRSVSSSGLYETHVSNIGSYFLVSLSFKLSDSIFIEVSQR